MRQTGANAALQAGIPIDRESCRDGRDLENGRDLEVQPLVRHSTYNPNSRWHKFKQAIIEPPKSTVSIYADIPFNHDEWKRHRNAAWRHRPQPILFMRVAGGFWWQLTYSFIVSLVVGAYHHHFQDVTAASSRLSVPFNLTTFALSLLLVFRTNSSYSRWWEARQVWGAVVNLSRNFARQSLVWMPSGRARVAVRWMMAAPYLLKCHLRFNASVRENVSHILLPQELDWVLGWTHRPNAAAHVLSTSVLEGRLDPIREKLLMELVDTYIDCVGKCERIFKTPIPAAYTRHTSRYLMIYLTACPLVLWPSLGWWTLVAAVLITFLLLGTENIGVQLEEPFRVLPLDDMCRGIEATLREMERHHGKLGEQFSTWLADPAGLSRASSESSLDSFQDGPADGPSEPEALSRFHRIPPPARLSAAAQALLQRRPSMQSHGGAGDSVAPPPSVASPSTGGGGFGLFGSMTRRGSGSGDLSVSHHYQQQHGGGGLIGGLLHHVLHPLGGGDSTSGCEGGGGGGASRGSAAEGATGITAAEACDLERGRSGVTHGPSHPGNPAPHYPHHVHYPHRRLPHHPMDVPSSALAASRISVASPATTVTSPSCSRRWEHEPHDATPKQPQQGPAAPDVELPVAVAQPAEGQVPRPGGAGGVQESPFAHHCQQQQQPGQQLGQEEQQGLVEAEAEGLSADNAAAAGGGVSGGAGRSGAAEAALERQALVPR